MRVESIEWSGLSTWTTPAPAGGCPWAGIAIGPESDEAAIRVNGVLLQAGRVLAVPSSGGYRIDRVLGIPGGANALNSVARLDVILFEHPDELASDVRRADGRHGAADVAVSSAVTYAELVELPFSGRRHALVTIVASAAPGSGSHQYKVVGRRFSTTRRVVEEFQIVTDQAFAETDRVAFHVGGTDHSEPFDELVILARTGDGVAVTMDVDAIEVT